MFEVSYDRPLEKKPNLVGFNDDDVWTIGRRKDLCDAKCLYE